MKALNALLSLGILILLAGCQADDPEEAAMNEVSEVDPWPRDSARAVTYMGKERGLIKNTDAASRGYVLFQPSLSTSTYIMDKDGQIVHEWPGTLNSMQSYLLPNGHLLRLERDEDFPVFAAGGQAGRICEYTWDGEKVWDFEYANENHLIHHDIEPLPNGNVLAISYEAISREEAIAAGRNPERVPPAGIWPDKVIEIKPNRPDGGEIVWEWRMWDHLVQDFDPAKPNYGEISDHPRRLNINVYSPEPPPPVTKEEIEGMKQMGVMTSNASVENRGSDITHTNAVDYNASLDQIAISVPGYNEIFIIDHSTTTEEARGSTGGKYGHGGDFLYRWGCPSNYGRGTKDDQVLFAQHDVRWVEEGYPGEGNLMMFNNDIPGPNSNLPDLFVAFMDSVTGFNPDPQVSVGDWSNYSAVYEIRPDGSSTGEYNLSEDGPFGPEELEWSYIAPDTFSLYSPFVSGGHRLSNGNTFIICGAPGRFFEVTPKGETVWDYWNPFVDDYTLPDGSAAQPNGPFIFAQFRADHLDAQHPGLKGRELTPLDNQPEVYTPQPPAQPNDNN